MSNSILGTFKTVLYRFNPETGYYQKTEEQPEVYPVQRLPFELKRQPTQEEKIKVNATEVIVSKAKTKKGSYKFITGLQPSEFKEWFIGNDYEMIGGKKITSAIIFNFTQNNSRLTVFYFARYDRESVALRMKWANYLIPSLMKKEG